MIILGARRQDAVGCQLHHGEREEVLEAVLGRVSLRTFRRRVFLSFSLPKYSHA